MHGTVQGVGFRPFVYALARSLELSGSVWNTGAGVVVEVEGSDRDLDSFGRRLIDDAPPLATVTEVSSTCVDAVGGTEFTIRESEQSAGRTFVAPDVTICDDCLDDLMDPDNRRYRHPFVTCTNCGPRFTITTGLPYDRPTTTMAELPAVRRVRAGVRRPRRSPVPRPDRVLPRMRTTAAPHPSRR